jgi:hypothetical protein
MPSLRRHLDASERRRYEEGGARLRVADTATMGPTLSGGSATRWVERRIGRRSAGAAWTSPVSDVRSATTSS